MPMIKLDNHVSDDTICSLGLQNTTRYYSYYENYIAHYMARQPFFERVSVSTYDSSRPT